MVLKLAAPCLLNPPAMPSALCSWLPAAPLLLPVLLAVWSGLSVTTAAVTACELCAAHQQQQLASLVALESSCRKCLTVVSLYLSLAYFL